MEALTGEPEREDDAELDREPERECEDPDMDMAQPRSEAKGAPTVLDPEPPKT